MVGHLLGLALGSRVPRWVAGHQRVAEYAVQVLRRRLPWWSLLIGSWLSAGYWPLTAEGHLLVGRTAFVLGALSATLALAAVASQAVEVYGALVGPACR